MDDKDINVPFVAYEHTMARFERTIKRLIILLGIVTILLFGTNVAWLYVWNQYDTSSVTVDTEDGGNANYIGDHNNLMGASGVIDNAEDSGSQKSQKEQKEGQSDQDKNQSQEMRKTFEIHPREEIEEQIDRWVICMRNAERNRAILKRALIDGISYERIAEEFGISVTTVKDAIYKSEEKLFTHWEP